MKKITIPADVAVVDVNGKTMMDPDGKPLVVTFSEFINKTILVDPKFGKSMADIMSAVEIKNKLTNVTVGSEVEFENSDYDRLKAIVEEPTNAYNPVFVMQMISFLMAVKNAK